MTTVSASAPGTTSLPDQRVIGVGRPRRAVPRKTGTLRILLTEFIAFAGAGRLAAAAGLIVTGSALEGIGILLIVPLLQAFLEPGANSLAEYRESTEWLLGSFGPATRSTMLLTAFAMLLVVRAIVLVERETRLARLQHGFVNMIKLALFQRIAAAPWMDVMAIDRPRLVKALGSDMVQVGLAVNAGLQTGTAALMLTAYACFAFMLAPGLALLTFGILAAVALIGFRSGRRAGAFGQALVGYDLRMATSASQFLAGLKLAKAQDLQSRFVASYAGASGAAVETRVAFVRSACLSRQVTNQIGALAAAAALIIAAFVSDVEPALLVTFVVLLSRTAGPLAQIQQGGQQVANALPMFAELNDLTARFPERQASTKSVAATNTQAVAPCSISLRGVSRTHRGTDGEVRGGICAVELDIAPGEVVGLSGPTGSGKSTLLDLIAGLDKPDSGGVLVEGRELAEAALTSHRAHLAYLGADPMLFGGTVRGNLAWAAPDTGDEEMWAAIETATATDLVERLGDGLDSRLHEAGANLSAGERQQIALARALLRRPSLLLLDEATCSLDAASERRLLARLASLEPRPTILFVSHRTESFALCGRVIDLAEGRVTSIRRVQ